MTRIDRPTIRAEIKLGRTFPVERVKAYLEKYLTQIKAEHENAFATLALWSGVPQKTIYSILNESRYTVQLSVVDKLFLRSQYHLDEIRGDWDAVHSD